MLGLQVVALRGLVIPLHMPVLEPAPRLNPKCLESTTHMWLWAPARLALGA